MKQALTLLLLVVFLTGCTRTFSGIQEDSENIWENTRDALHRATSP
ncbi:MAG: Unknown protein [uncultured Sulfurovum sp.]|uniref:Entericidin EcnAB n=1 Tax=uncultured Sulfurovum sp. TaxID=269237 RepID=A0A6S6T1N4_9BACT|nr:MAG: Unknown protein [uncultured Sulfurovum sp.]